jgi:uncharacterized membrane protein
MKKLLVRLQNKRVLLSILSGVLLILVNTGVIDVGMSQQVEVIVNTVLGILITLGIVSDPESHVPKE